MTASISIIPLLTATVFALTLVQGALAQDTVTTCSGGICETTDDPETVARVKREVLILLIVAIVVPLFITIIICIFVGRRVSRTREWQRKYVLDAEARAAAQATMQYHAQTPVGYGQPPPPPPQYVNAQNAPAIYPQDPRTQPLPSGQPF